MDDHPQRPRCYADPASWGENAVVLSKSETHHLVHVLRHDIGAAVTVIDGLGRLAHGKIVDFVDQCAVISIEENLVEKPAPFAVEVVQAIPKKGRMEAVLQKATELGADAVQPIVTQRTIVRLDKERAKRKHERWRSIIIEAAKQCRRTKAPALKPVIDFEQFLSLQTERDLLILCSLEDDAQPLKDVVESIDYSRVGSVKILVGPEGDFTAEEYRAARDAGAKPVTLGKLVMRTDTATLYMLSILNYLLEV